MSWGKATMTPSRVTDLIFLGSNRHAVNLASENLSGIKAALSVGCRVGGRRDCGQPETNVHVD